MKLCHDLCHLRNLRSLHWNILNDPNYIKSGSLSKPRTCAVDDSQTWAGNINGLQIVLCAGSRHFMPSMVGKFGNLNTWTAAEYATSINKPYFSTNTWEMTANHHEGRISKFPSPRKIPQISAFCIGILILFVVLILRHTKYVQVPSP